MPATLRREHEQAWLDPSSTDVEQLLEPLDAEQMETDSVSSLVKSWDNEGPELIAPSRAPVEVQIPLPLE